MGKCPVCKKEDDFVIVDEDGFCIHYKKQLNQDEIEDQKTDLKLQEISKDVEELKEYSDKFIALNESWQRGYDYAKRELKGDEE